MGVFVPVELKRVNFIFVRIVCVSKLHGGDGTDEQGGCKGNLYLLHYIIIITANKLTEFHF